MKSSSIRRLPFGTLAALALVAGCFTVRETDYPETRLTPLPKDRELRVQVAGFEANIISYVPVFGYETVVTTHPGWYGPHGGATTVATSAYVPQVSPSRVFRDRAVDLLEKGGYTLQAAEPRYRVEVVFSGPFTADGDSWKSFAWNLFTLFTAEQANQTWTAKLRIHEIASGKPVLSVDYTQPYDVLVWGPIPIFSPGGSTKTQYGAIQSWCLTALTDRAIADATAFLADKGLPVKR